MTAFWPPTQSRRYTLKNDQMSGKWPRESGNPEPTSQSKRERNMSKSEGEKGGGLFMGLQKRILWSHTHFQLRGHDTTDNQARELHLCMAGMWSQVGLRKYHYEQR